LREALIDSFLVAGKGYLRTWPRRGSLSGLPLPPLFRIDYVWHLGGLEPLALWAAEVRGSDHLALVADFRFDPLDPVARSGIGARQDRVSVRRGPSSVPEQRSV
jgi:hypothetical protein